MRNDLKLEGIFLDNLKDVVTGKMPYKLSDIGSGKLWRKRPVTPKRPVPPKPIVPDRTTFVNPLLKRSALLNPAAPRAEVIKPPIIAPNTTRDTLIPKQPVVNPPLRAPDNTFKQSSDRFAEFDLNTPNGVAGYAQICQAFINSRNPNAGITGNMMASSAKKTFQSTGRYVPPELALAQLALEGGLSTNPNAIPIKTNNPYNVGNWDKGKRTPFPNKQMGIDRYYSVIAKNYLSNNRNAEDILQNFTNTQGNRYASAENYEQNLNKLVNQISGMKQLMSIA
jgi:hypothetical protein